MKPNKTSPPISATHVFECSTDELWTLISAPGNLNDAHPFCKTNEALTWNGEEHVDRLVYLNGRTYVEGFRRGTPARATPCSSARKAAPNPTSCGPSSQPRTVALN